ncbi:MAG: hypothetical protein K6F84_08795 [Lachnospiraceae bacterium]|nr:hypothetical protein [Lachnospiraceae bacterium]
MPDEHDEKSIFSPALLGTLLGVMLFVFLIVSGVLKSNSLKESKEARKTPVPTKQVVIKDDPEIETGSSLTPEDLDFWDKYPEEKESEPTNAITPLPTATPFLNDPTIDGNHTLVINRDGSEEWVVISRYLLKNDYEDTNLVCQSGIMKYFEDGKQVSFTGIDVSQTNDYIDYGKVKKAGVDFVLIRGGLRGYGSGTLSFDEAFYDNVKGAADAGLDVGVYFTSNAVTKEEAVEEAASLLDMLTDIKIVYPVIFDMGFVDNDTSRIEALSKADKTDVALAFLGIMKESGYKTCIAGTKEWLIKEIDMSKLSEHDVWLKNEGDIPDYPYRFAMWQYSKEGKIDGVRGNVNMDISFINYREK